MLVANASLVSSSVKESAQLLFRNYLAVADLDPFPDIPAEKMTELASLGAIVESAADSSELLGLEGNLAEWMESVHGQSIDLDAATATTSNPLNRRMIDVLFMMKPKIRSTRQRLNDAGGGYDMEAYVQARNRASLLQSVYIFQLDNDIVDCTNEQIVTLEQTHYGAIENATAATFVASIEGTAQFMEPLVKAPLA